MKPTGTLLTVVALALGITFAGSANAAIILNPQDDNGNTNGDGNAALSTAVVVEDPPGVDNYLWDAAPTVQFIIDTDNARDAASPHGVVAFSPGLYAIEVSWGVYFNGAIVHASSVDFILDVDGVGVGDDTLGSDRFYLAQNINQNFYNDQDTGTPLPAENVPHWSGFYAGGVFNVAAASEIIVVSDAPSTGALTVAVVRLTEVPSPAALPVGAALLALAAIGRRNRHP